ncbi:MAG: hypothetical protein LBF58_07325 [Deltaproteobacteria bacterium]|jgi:hypothetical protein|nr:hypothetical protein [Deltaproteobacteria bacterium]
MAKWRVDVRWRSKNGPTGSSPQIVEAETEIVAKEIAEGRVKSQKRDAVEVWVESVRKA